MAGFYSRLGLGVSQVSREIGWTSDVTGLLSATIMARFEARLIPWRGVLVVLASSCAPAGPAVAPAAGNGVDLELVGVDTSDLTSTERRLWANEVSTLDAPCPEVAATVAACVRENRTCAACGHAANLIRDQVRMGKTAAQIRQAYRARFSPTGIENVELGDSPSQGDPKARVVIVEWADFECSHCGEASAMLHRLVQKYPHDVRLVFKHFPISAHPHADFAARAAVAAHEQGKFWKFHESLFAHQAVGLDESRIRQLAREAGVDMTVFEQSVASAGTKARVLADREQAQRLGARGTPTVFINGRFFDSTHFSLAQDLEGWIRTELDLTTPARALPAAAGQGQ